MKVIRTFDNIGICQAITLCRAYPNVIKGADDFHAELMRLEDLGKEGKKHLEYFKDELTRAHVSVDMDIELKKVDEVVRTIKGSA